jgi:hypothetical protein
MSTIPAVLHRMDSGALAAVRIARNFNMGLTNPRLIGHALPRATWRPCRIHPTSARTFLHSSCERPRGSRRDIANETTCATGATCHHRSRHPRTRGCGRVMANRAQASNRCTATHARSGLRSLSGAQRGWRHHANSANLWKQSNGPACEPRVAGSGTMRAYCRTCNPRFVRRPHAHCSYRVSLCPANTHSYRRSRDVRV